MTVLSIHVPAQVKEPRGSVIAANLASWLLNRVEAAMTRRGDRRLAADRQAEAAAVRRLAHEVGQQDPRFAADLLAAADRHERG